QPFGDFIHDLAIVLLISLPFFVFFRFGGMPRAKGLFRAKVSISIIFLYHIKMQMFFSKIAYDAKD
ncbi:hypothetical protein, partial [Acinetobacter baumannii]|uniref:hypothetical protein n=1 Tax=Acinetobacter baumannii TaxID=470 RepID=UPI001C0A2A55